MKVSNRNSFRANQNYSESFRYLYPSQCESIWTNPNADSFGLILIHSDRSLGLSRINFHALFNKRDSKFVSDWLGLIRIGSDIDIGMILNSSDWLGMNSYPKFSPGITRRPDLVAHILIFEDFLASRLIFENLKNVLIFIKTITTNPKNFLKKNQIKDQIWTNHLQSKSKIPK